MITKAMITKAARNLSLSMSTAELRRMMQAASRCPTSHVVYAITKEALEIKTGSR